MENHEPPAARRADKEPLEDELPTLEMEIAQLKQRVAEVEKSVAWIKSSVRVQARGRLKTPPLGDSPRG